MEDRNGPANFARGGRESFWAFWASTIASALAATRNDSRTPAPINGMTCYRFDSSLHVLAADVQPGKTMTIAGRVVETLAAPITSQILPFEITFEEAADKLAALPRMFVEPDGSFVWTGDDECGRWQVDGNLYDRAGRLLYVDLAGNCPQAQFDHLVAALGWPATPIAFHLRREGVWLAEPVFRGWAGECP